MFSLEIHQGHLARWNSVDSIAKAVKATLRDMQHEMKVAQMPP